MSARGQRGARRIAAALAACIAVLGAGAVAASADDPPSDTLGISTLDARIVPTGDGDFKFLTLSEGGEPYAVREGAGGTVGQPDAGDLGIAQDGRAERRESLLYFGQLSDFQLADEESPARVEFLDFGPFSSAWRTNDAFLAHQAEAMIRQINAFAPASPVPAGDGSRRAMDFTINTGDAADSQQKNETEWVRTLAEGGTLAAGSGTNPLTSGDPICLATGLLGLVADSAAPQNYTGVQDYDDFLEGIGQYYDPDNPLGAFSEWPTWPGLMDAAQAAFEAEGLDVPHYLTFGNHDALVQGNAAANTAFEAVATGCVKPMLPLTADPTTLEDALADIAALDLTAVLNLVTSDPTKIALVPPDQGRQFVSKKQYKEIFRNGTQADGHGFDHVDPAEEAASSGAAGYYAWNPEPGVRFISVDTVSEGGVIGPSAEGNIDHPQYLWLQGQFEEAEEADELVVLFSHHAIPSLNASVPDEVAPPCTLPDAHGHDLNPGCDLDPRSSSPIHLGDDMANLLHQYPNVIAWVAGHSHQNTVDPYPNPSGEGGFWSIRVAAEADWPQQSRLLEIFDNEDGTLSIFGTILDHAGPSAAAADGTPAAGMGPLSIASIGRTVGFNDPQYGGEACNPTCEGAPGDRNVELIVADPREGGPVDPPPDGACETKTLGTQGPDLLAGTADGDLINGRGGKDRIAGRGGDDCLRGGKGSDRLRGNGGDDRLGGGKGNDRINPGAGEDVVRGGNGRDSIRADDGERDVIRCGRGRDRVRADVDDVIRGCERGVVGGP